MPLKLLLTTDAVGGVWRYTIDLASALADRGIAPIIAVLGPPASASQRQEAESIPGLHLIQTGLPLDWTAESPAALAQTSQRLSALAALTGAQSIHLHAPALIGATPWPAPIVAVCHSDLGTWWQAMRTEPPPPDFTWRIEATAQGLHRAQKIIAPTASHAEAMRTQYGPLETEVIHNGASQLSPVMAGLDPATPVAGLAATHAVPPTTTVKAAKPKAVLTAGRLWDEAKSAALLNTAAPHLTVPIQAAGPTTGPNGNTIHLPNLHLLGTLSPPAMAEAYASATVFASMAQYEPFGLAVLEAAQAGLRLVLSDIPTFRELWDGAATFVTNPADLPSTLQHALNTPGDGGAKERAGAYTLEKMTGQTLALHRALTS